MLETDQGSRYLGEFAIGTNKDITRFTGNILFDEKIGGSFHMALGAGYPETGSKNVSSIPWDMICGLRKDSEILVGGLTFRDEIPRLMDGFESVDQRWLRKFDERSR